MDSCESVYILLTLSEISRSVGPVLVPRGHPLDDRIDTGRIQHTERAVLDGAV